MGNITGGIVSSPDDLLKCYRLRYATFSEAMGYEPKNEARQERDGYDRQSIHLSLNRAGADAAQNGPLAYMRMILPNSSSKAEPLPFQKIYADNPGPLQAFEQLSKSRPFEISRICKLPATPPAAVVYLQFCALALARKLGLMGAVVMVQPKFAGRLMEEGLHVKQIGPKVSYHGERAGYWLSIQQGSFSKKHPEMQRAANRDMERSLQRLALAPA